MALMRYNTVFFVTEPSGSRSCMKNVFHTKIGWYNRCHIFPDLIMEWSIWLIKFLIELAVTKTVFKN